MSMLKVGNMTLDKQENLEQHVLSYYQSLFASENTCIINDLIDSVIPSLVYNDDNLMLTNIPTIDEVKNAVFNMNNNGAPGLDGFGGSFYQKYWNIIKDDAFNSVTQFFT